MENKASIYDYARMCKFYDDCKKCPLGSYNNGLNKLCDYLAKKDPDKANEIILKWREEHPVKTRQDKFLEMFPNAIRFENSNIIAIKPCDMDTDYASIPCALTCDECRREYWLAEVDENE